MIGTESIGRVMGKDVYGASGEKIGAASEVYLDDDTGQPEWLTVRTGLFGSKESFVPIRDAALTDDSVRVPVSKSAVKDAPKIDTDGHLSPQEEDELYRYYGMDFGDRSGEAPPREADTDGGMTTDARTTDARTTDAMTRSEERLTTGTRSEEVGRARLRKYIVTENVTEKVPVSHEEMRVRREPITDANVGEAMAGPDLSEAEHEVTLHAERPVAEKETVPVERVRLDKDTVTDEETVSAELRKEEIEIEAPGEPDRRS